MLQIRTHNDLVIIESRSLVAAARIGHCDEATVMLLHVTIRKAKLPQQFHAANLKPDEVIGVVHHTHLVGFGVAHARLARFAVHLPLQRGFRFSRNDVMPSRKSSVVRTPALSWIAAAICWSS